MKLGCNNRITPIVPIITANTLDPLILSKKISAENINTKIGAVNKPAPASATERNVNPPKWQKIARVLKMERSKTLVFFWGTRFVLVIFAATNNNATIIELLIQ